MEFFNKIFDKLTVTKYYGQYTHEYNLFEKILFAAGIIFGLVCEYMILKSKGIL